MSELGTPKTVYFVRHGESSGNIVSASQGPDAVLTEKGTQQAELIAARVARLEFDVLLASPLPRTKETAEIIAATTGKEVEYVDLFVERVKPTRLIGKSRTDPEVKELAELYQRSLCTPGLRAEDAENFDDLSARADEALGFLARRAEKNIVVVAHGYFLRMMLARVLFGQTLTGEAFGIFQTNTLTENTGITVLRHESTWEGSLAWKLWVYNDHAHLG